MRHLTRSASLALTFLAACTAPPLPTAGALAGQGAGGAVPPQTPAVAAAPAPAVPAAAAAPATVPAAQTAATAPLSIHNNRGGNVLQTMAQRAELMASGRQVRISGACDSACTMFITMPNACLAPDATIGFHAPRLPGTQVIPPIVDQMMATTYRNGIRARWFSEWRHQLAIQRITAREYVALDPMTRLCTN